MDRPILQTFLQDPRLPRLEARMLLEHVLQKPRAWMLAHDTDPIEPWQAQQYQALVTRRLAGEPMAYLVGHREFMGHDFAVTPDVLIPRPETELLVETALQWLAGHPEAAVLDLGTGSGVIAVSIALGAPQVVSVTATDASAAALQVAVRNAARLGARVDFAQGSWYDALPARARYDLIVSNPPYIARDDEHMRRGDLRFEPRRALTDGADGLRDLAAIVAGAAARLRPGGALWVEHGWDQAAAVRQLLLAAGFGQVASRRDLAGIERISGGSL
ncbi:peptide chain release factor N(5)-glutamine methyltransferase [Bordetella petrii]